MSMRVAIFFDGKNFYSGWKDRTDQRRIDFEKMSEWIVREAGGPGAVLWGAYYYTSVETGVEAQTEGQRKLAAFLDERELDRGFFVKRFPRKAFTTTCRTCGANDRIFQEKEVDTTMVADMLTLAAVGAFDIAVLVSGDADHAPAVEGVRQLGKKVLVGTWAGYGLSPRIRKAAFHHIDLCKGLSEFGLLPPAPGAAAAGGLPAGEAYGEERRPLAHAGAPPAEAAAGAAPQARAPAPQAAPGAAGGDEFAAGLDAPSRAHDDADRLHDADAMHDAAHGHDPDARYEQDAYEETGYDYEGREGAAHGEAEPRLDALYSGPGTPGAFTVALAAQRAQGASRDAWTEATDQGPRLDAQGAMFLDELVRALEKFRGGYVGLNFFLTRWKSPRMDASPESRRRVLDGLKDGGFVEVYESQDGSKALRLGPRAVAMRGS